MSFNEQHQQQINARSAFPSKQQLREADALAFAQRRGAGINPSSIPGVTTAAALLQERREFDDANAIRHAQYQADVAAQRQKAKAPTCRELAERVKESEMVSFKKSYVDQPLGEADIYDFESNESTIKDILVQMLGKIHRLERQVKSLEEINEAQAELVIKLSKKFKSDTKSAARDFDSAGS